MQLFAAVHGGSPVPAGVVAEALGGVATRFAELDLGTAEEFSSPDGCLVVAAVSHGAAAAGPRRYRARRGDTIVLYDGLPVDGQDGFRGTDAGALLERWDALPGRLDGQFAALRADLAAGELSVLLDVLGMVPVYFSPRRDGGVVVSNSVDVVRAVNGRGELDLLGVATTMTLGWVVGGHTLDANVRALPGGRVHVWDVAGHRERIVRTPADIAPVRGGRPGPDHRELTESLVRLTRAALDGNDPVLCAITGGRDTRLCLALALAAGARPELYTFGAAHQDDVRLGAEVARLAGLPHRTWWPDDGAERPTDWPAAATAFTHRLEGLAALQQIRDVLEPPPAPGRVAVKLWGVGGEMSRVATGVLDGGTENVPVLRDSRRFARALLTRKLGTWDGLVTADGLERSRRYMEDFIAEREQEGWSPAATAEAWFVYERIGRFGATGARRTATTSDVFSPFCSMPFMDHVYALPAAERYLEGPNRRLLLALTPELDTVPYEEPWPAQRPRLATAAAVRDLGRAGVKLVRSRVRHQPPEYGIASPVWLEHDLDLHREVVLSRREAGLWDVVDRRRVEELLAASPDERAHQARGLERLLTLAWRLHLDA